MNIQPSLPMIAALAGTPLAQTGGADHDSRSATAAAARRAEAPAASTDTLALHEGAGVGDRGGDGRSSEGEERHPDSPEQPEHDSSIADAGPADLRGRGRRLDLHG